MAILDDRTLDFTSNSVEQTVRLGIKLGNLLQSQDVICLSGELGAGKTALARGIGEGWGTTQRVTSPTFTIINEYPRPKDGRILYHLDCYRLEEEGDIVTIGLDDIFDTDHAMMIEWPERVISFLPGDRLTIELSYINPMRRTMRVQATGPRSQQLLQAFRRSAFGA